jgi:ABC-type transporter Mla maintaining outer membrane lipid asymmetry permease subunit MlaE
VTSPRRIDHPLAQDIVGTRVALGSTSRTGVLLAKLLLAGRWRVR